MCEAGLRIVWRGLWLAKNLIRVQVEVALGGTILLFLVPQVPKEFDRRGAVPGC